MGDDYHRTAPIQSPPASPIRHPNTNHNPASNLENVDPISIPNISSNTTKNTGTLSTKSSTSRFKFHSDTQAPFELNKLELLTAQSITAFRTRLNKIDRKIATWNARFGNEIVDRDRDMVGMLDYVCVDPLERASENFFYRLNEELGEFWGVQDKSQLIDEEDGGGGHSDHGEDGDEDGNDQEMNLNDQRNRHDGGEDNMTFATSATGSATNSTVEKNKVINRNENDSSFSHDDDVNEQEELQNTTRPSIKSISNQISSLSSKLDEHIYITTPNLIQKNFHDFQTIVQNTIPSHLTLEKLKSSKREQSIHQKFEPMAGLTVKSIQEEKASSTADLTILRQGILEAGGWDEKRTCRFLKEIQDIRDMLRVEREERMRNDEHVLNQIVETREVLQRTLLDSLAQEE